jgi:hypothetical protein
VAHACNPSYSGGRDQEDGGSKPAWANSSVRSYLEKPFTKIRLVEWLKVKTLSSSSSTIKYIYIYLPTKCEVLRSNPSVAPPLTTQKKVFYTSI